MSSHAPTEARGLTPPRSAGRSRCPRGRHRLGSHRRAGMPRRAARDRHRAARHFVRQRGRTLCAAQRWVRLRSGTAGAAVPMVHRGGRRLAAQHGGHMSVEWLLERSGRHAQRLLILGGNLLVIVSYVVLCRQALLVADVAAAERSPVLGLPNSHGYWAMAAACALLVLAMAAISVRVALFGRRRCPSPIPRRCRHEHSPRDRLLRPDGPGDPGRSCPDHRLRGSAALAGQPAAAARGAADVRPDPVLPDAGAALLHAGRQPDDGGQVGPGVAGLRDPGDGPLPRRPTVHHRGCLGRVRGRVRQRRRQRQRARLDPDPVAAQAGLPGRTLRGEQRDVRGDRHSDPAVDPDDPLRPGERVSIADLFIAGVLPGVLMAAGFILVCNLDRAPAGLRLRGAPHGAPRASASWCAAARPS